VVWAVFVFSFLPILRLDLYLSDQFIAAQFFISSFILVLAWPFSGPLVAAILSILSSALSVYLGLRVKEPSYFLEPGFNAALFLWVAIYLQRVQRRTRDLFISKEKLVEDLNLVQKNIIKKQHLKEALQRKIDHFLDLERFSEELKEETTLSGAGEKIVGRARDVLAQADECALYLVNESEQELNLVARTGLKEDLSSMSPPGGIPLDQWVAKRGQAVMVEDVLSDFRLTPDAGLAFGGIRSACAIPLVTENRVLGVIRASSRQTGCFTADDTRLLDIFSSLGAVTLKNILLYEKTVELGTRDSLTGLFVNRFFSEKLTQTLQKASSEQEPFSVIFMDIDLLKKFNDEYGHSAGDLLLKTIASLITVDLDPDDWPARYGGEEFAVLLLGKPKKTALQIAEKIRDRIEKNIFVVRRTRRLVTASFGVASYPQDGRTKDELIRACDKFLYEAKKSGRNRVCGAT